jgi:hypothetical protein
MTASENDIKLSDLDIDTVTQVLLQGTNGVSMNTRSIDDSDGGPTVPNSQDKTSSKPDTKDPHPIVAATSNVPQNSSSSETLSNGSNNGKIDIKSAPVVSVAPVVARKDRVISFPKVEINPLEVSINRAMDSNDAKIIQYQYAIVKLKEILTHVRKMQTQAVDLPLIHYIVLYTRSVLAINEKEFGPKLDLLSGFKLFKLSPSGINISPTVTHIPYDISDLVINPLEDLPSVEQAKKCLHGLEILLSSALSGYQKRLDVATKDKSLIGSIYTLLQSSLSGEDCDLSLIDMTFPLPPGNKIDDDTAIEACLIDMDIHSMFTIIKQMKAVLSKLKPIITKYKLFEFKNIPSYALHEIFILSVRLNDLYTIFRSFGRKVVLSNLPHLQDQKFLVQSRNGAYLRLGLSKMDDLFNTNKKNGTLIATLTRFIRQNSLFEINSKNVKDFINFINQGFNVILTSIVTTEDFMMNWLVAEIKFRKFYNLPRKELLEIYSKNIPVAQTKTSANFSTNTGKDQSLTVPTSRVRKGSTSSVVSATSSISSSESFPSIVNVKAEALALVPMVTRGSRSSSVSSVNSNNSLRLGSKASLQRPQSMIFNGNTSLTKLDSPPKPLTRRRSNSQPLANTNAALVGAAAALSRGLRSPLGSIKRTPPARATSLSPVNTPSPPTVTKPSSSSITKKLLAVAEENDSKVEGPVKLSANQRLQLHLRQASKSGSLMTQKKEQLTSVTFDPSNPSSVQIRKYTEKPISPPPQQQPSTPTPSAKPPVQLAQPSVTPSVQPVQLAQLSVEDLAKLPASITKPTMFGKPTKRDMVTRQNTQLNSKPVQIDDSDDTETDLESKESTPSVSSGSGKKVRFTGVPRYNEEEDMPTNYANQILKNFASFRAPSYRNNQAFKKRESMLKKEESITLRKELHQHGGEP